MSTVYEFAGLRVVIYTNDHAPAHVHVMGNGGGRCLQFECAAGLVAMRGSLGFSKHEISRIENELNHYRDMLIAAWEQIHDHH